MTRRKHRYYAFAVVYQMPFVRDFDALISYGAILEYIADMEPNADVCPEYIKTPVEGICRHLSDIDAYIERNLKNWSPDRIASVDLAVLRLAVYEILYDDTIPVAVSVNEAVELAKAYGTDDSASFVNGVLAGVVREASSRG